VLVCFCGIELDFSICHHQEKTHPWLPHENIVTNAQLLNHDALMIIIQINFFCLK